MNPYQVNNRQNGFIAALAAAAAVAALGLASGTSLRANTDTWTGPSANWNTPTDWSEGVLPGTNPDTVYTDGQWDDIYITNGTTVTVNTSLAANSNTRYFTLNGTATAASTLTVATGGYLAVIPNGGQATVAGGYNATVNITGGTFVTGSIALGGGGVGTLNVSSGLIGTTGNVNTGATSCSLNVGNGAVNLSGGTINTGEYGGITLGNNTSQPATFTQTGGTLDNGRQLIVGGSAAGVYTLQAGTMEAGTNNQSFVVGQNATGTFTMTGGTLTNQNPTQIGGGTGTGTATLSGGSATLATLIVGNSANTGSGTLVIQGSGASISASSGLGGSPMQTFANGTLDFQIGSNGVSTIVANSPSNARGIINLSGTLQMDLLAGFTPTHGQQFVLITTDVTGTTDPNTKIAYAGIVTANVTYNNNYSNVTNTGLNLDPADSSLWSWAVDPITSGSNITGYQLVATYTGASPPIPEPASLGLMSVAGLGILLVGRKRKPA